jgi:hypothetical protein
MNANIAYAMVNVGLFLAVIFLIYALWKIKRGTAIQGALGGIIVAVVILIIPFVYYKSSRGFSFASDQFVENELVEIRYLGDGGVNLRSVRTGNELMIPEKQLVYGMRKNRKDLDKQRVRVRRQNIAAIGPDGTIAHAWYYKLVSDDLIIQVLLDTNPRDAMALGLRLR